MRKNNLAILFVLTFISLFLSLSFLTIPDMLFMTCSLLIIGLIIILSPQMGGFAALIAFISGLAFYNVASNWGKSLSLWFQGDMILKQTIFSYGAIVTWLAIHTIKQFITSTSKLQEEVESLRKLEPVTGALTFNEFLENARLLHTGMRRRVETGYYLICDMEPSDREFKNRVIYEKLMAKLLLATRRNYDLVGQLGSYRAVIFLSNTNRQGVDIVLSRFNEFVLEEKNLNPECFRFMIHEIPSEWDAFGLMLRTAHEGARAS